MRMINPTMARSTDGVSRKKTALPTRPGSESAIRGGLLGDDEFAPVPLLSASVSVGTRRQTRKMTAWEFHGVSVDDT
jgi:hypothetical protein